mmetsp:Transcript_40099/g.87586  ORF Transcript_40099/g.87586 Transcript_40099/m.87586 type:complete len:160 (-) Transcript_40099:309-788(-)
MGGSGSYESCCGRTTTRRLPELAGVLSDDTGSPKPKVNVTLDEEGYRYLVRQKDVAAMAQFVRRVVAKEGLAVIYQDELACCARWHCLRAGVDGSYATLRDEVCQARWVIPKRSSNSARGPGEEKTSPEKLPEKMPEKLAEKLPEKLADKRAAVALSPA